MKRFFQNFISFLSVLIILAFIAYTGLWFYIAGQMNGAIGDIWTHQEEYQITIAGDQPHVSGFPAPPKLIFSGSVTDRNGITYASPEFSYQGFSLPTQPITLSAPQGLDFSGPIFKKSIHLDNFKLRIRLPANFPHSFEKDNLHAWQKQGGTVPVEELTILRGSLKLLGDGYLNLDEKLQPAGNLAVELTGLDDLLNEMVADGLIGNKQALMAQSLINLMSQKNETNGESALKTGIRIESGGVFLGPLRVASLPEWQWRNDNPPGPH